jgi:hypothetical protein
MKKYYLHVKFLRTGEVQQTGRTDGYDTIEELAQDARFHIEQEAKRPDEIKVIVLTAEPADSLVIAKLYGLVIHGK